jgi:hypothetical protein
MRPPSDLKPRRKNPRRMLSARVNQTRLDDVILPVFCPTSQTSCATRLRPPQSQRADPTAKAGLTLQTLPQQLRIQIDMKKPAADCSARAEPNSFR